MKLKSISVKNFRGLSGEGNIISFEKSNIIFIFGQNNIGKSTFLRAYEYFVTPNQKADLSDFYQQDLNNIIEMVAVFEKEDSDTAEFTDKGLLKWVNQDDSSVTFRKTWVGIDKPGKKETLQPGQGYKDNGFGGLEQFLTKAAPTPISIPAMPTPTDLEKWVADVIKKQALKSLEADEQVKYHEALEKLKALQDAVQSKNHVTAMSEKANHHFQKVFPELELNISAVPGEQVDISKVLEKEFNVTIKSIGDEFNQGFESHGHGVIRQAMFNFLGIANNAIVPVAQVQGVVRKEFIILFEEPELYLHPKRIRLLRETLYSLCVNSPYQILCASHNPQMIDISKPHTSMARLVANADGSSSIHQVGHDVFASDDEQKNRVLMLNRFNPHICETFFADEVILVEGDTEAIVLREIFNRFAPERDIFIVNTGTKNNIPFFIEVLTHFRIKQHVIHDSDSRFLYESNGSVIQNQDGSMRANSAWTLNGEIWRKLQAANAVQERLSQRYVFIHNFESAHGYRHDKSKGKPLSAYEFAANINLNSSLPIMNFFKEISGMTQRNTLYTDADLERLVAEPGQLIADPVVVGS